MDVASLSIGLAGLLLSLVAVVTSTFILVRQTMFMRHSNHIPVLVDLLQEYRSADFQEAQDYVLHRLAAEHDPSLALSALPGEARVHARTVANYFTGLGALVCNGMVDERCVISMLGYNIDKAWRVLEPYIRSERELRGDAEYKTFYEDLVCRARANWPPKSAYGFKMRSVPVLPERPG